MRKLLIALSVAALTTSVYAMSKAPADAGAADASKTPAVKEASACADKAACDAKKAAASAEKTAEETTGCAGGICPLKK